MAAYVMRGGKHTHACLADLCFLEKVPLMWILHQLSGVKIQVSK